MPAKPSNNPRMFWFLIVIAENNPISTSHKGKIDPMIEPNPAEINFTPHVDRELLKVKFKKLKTIMNHHSFPFGQVAPLTTKKIT